MILKYMKYNTKPLFSGFSELSRNLGHEIDSGSVINLIHCFCKSIDYVILTISVGRGHKVARVGVVIMGCQPCSCFEKKVAWGLHNAMKCEPCSDWLKV